MKKNPPNTKYAVMLARTANSFYDPESGANLFKNTPYYFFNHKPTHSLISGVKNGKLIDLKNNVLEEQSTPSYKAEYTALRAMYDTLLAEHEVLKRTVEELKASQKDKSKADKSKGKTDEPKEKINESKE